jgi:hypothetical protein
MTATGTFDSGGVSVQGTAVMSPCGATPPATQGEHEGSVLAEDSRHNTESQAALASWMDALENEVRGGSKKGSKGKSASLSGAGGGVRESFKKFGGKVGGVFGRGKKKAAPAPASLTGAGDNFYTHLHRFLAHH